MSAAWAFFWPVLLDIVLTIFVVEGLLRRQEQRRTSEARRAAATLVSGATMELLVLSAAVFALKTGVGEIRVPAQFTPRRTLSLPVSVKVPPSLRRITRTTSDLSVFQRRSTVPALADLAAASEVRADLEVVGGELSRVSQDLGFAIGGSMGLLEPPLFRAVIELRLATGELCLAGAATQSNAHVVRDRLAREQRRAARRFRDALVQTVTALRSSGVEMDGALA